MDEKKRWLKMNRKYQLVDHNKSFHDKHWSIRIDEGEYEGVIYQYDTVSLKEEGEDVILDFNVINLENPNSMDLTDDKMSDIMGDILVELLEDYLKEQEKNAENGNTDTEELDSQ